LYYNRETDKQKEVCIDAGRYNSKIKDFLAPFKISLNKTKATHYSIAKDLTQEQEEQFLNNTTLNEPEEDITYYKQFYKIPCADLDIQEVYKIFCAANIKKYNNSGLYINDIDYTTDIKGCMCKEALIDYLVDNHNYKNRRNLRTA